MCVRVYVCVLIHLIKVLFFKVGRSQVPDLLSHCNVFPLLLVCALSPVSHKRLHQVWTQTSLYLQVIHFTSHFTTSHFFFTLFIFHGHSTREPASDWVTYFILQAYTGPDVSHSRHGKKLGEVWKKCRWMNRKGRISKEEIPGSKHSMYGYMLTYSWL